MLHVNLETENPNFGFPRYTSISFPEELRVLTNLCGGRFLWRYCLSSGLHLELWIKFVLQVSIWVIKRFVCGSCESFLCTNQSLSDKICMSLDCESKFVSIKQSLGDKDISLDCESSFVQISVWVKRYVSGFWKELCADQSLGDNICLWMVNRVCLQISVWVTRHACGLWIKQCANQSLGDKRYILYGKGSAFPGRGEVEQRVEWNCTCLLDMCRRRIS